MKPRTLCVYTCELRLETREIGRNIKEANADVPPERKVRTKGLPTDTPEKCWRDDKVLSFSRLPEDTSRPAAPSCAAEISPLGNRQGGARQLWGLFVFVGPLLRHALSQPCAATGDGPTIFWWEWESQAQER